MGCRATRPKDALVRIVRLPDGSADVDPSGKREGRGAYLCPSRECLETAAKRKALERALKSPVSPEVLERLRDRLAIGGA